MVLIRAATPQDLPAITSIYNEAIATTTATFDLEPKSLEDRECWLMQRSPRHPVIVAEKNGAVLGWASLSPWSERLAYADSAENSIYIDSQSRGIGVGKELMQALLIEARKAKFHTVIARIGGESEASIRLHKSVGFTRVGKLKEVGWKFGRFHDVHLFQHLLW